MTNFYLGTSLCAFLVFGVFICRAGKAPFSRHQLENELNVANNAIHTQIPTQLQNQNHREKRLAIPGNSTKIEHKKYQSCIGPGSTKGHCTHVANCMHEEYRNTFPRFMDYMCIIENQFVGICCPDNATIQHTATALAGNLAGSLPAIATVGDDAITFEDQDTLENTTIQEVVVRQSRAYRGCGMTSNTKTRVIGGHAANPKEWPWMAALLRDAEHYCGGVLITDRHILTAAHCTFNLKPREITVRLGEYDFSNPNETRALNFKVVEIRNHRDFVKGTYENDIAIVKIHRPTSFNSYIWPICLPPVGAYFVGKDAVVTGWGTQYYGGPASYTLMEVTVPVWPQDKCRSRYIQRIPDTAMCAGGYEGGRDSCQGDSGGPLVHQLENGRWVNIGIVSWGIRCGDAELPGIYTRVNSYLDWIFANAVF